MFGENEKSHKISHSDFSDPVPFLNGRRPGKSKCDMRMGEKSNAYRILVGNPEGKRPQGRPRRKWVNNVKIDFKGIELGGIDWTDLAQDRDQWRVFVNKVMKLRVP
jgi:hypothetical protein